MYLIPIQVPIYLDNDRKLITTEWRRSLELLRDSFGGRFGEIAVAAPSLPASSAPTEQTLVEAPGATDGMVFFPSFDLRCRARQYWLRERTRWRAELIRLTQRADVVHAGMDDVYRPIAFEGFRIGVRLGKPTVFVQDTDLVLQQRQLSAGGGLAQRAKARSYTLIYERMCRWGVARADLSLLKGSALIQRYGPYAKNAREFHDTSFSAADVLSEEALIRRLATLNEQRPLRLVYCGRLTARKGVDRSLQILARANELGCSVEFDIIGDGPEMHRLESMANSSGIGQRTRFLGARPYDAALLRQLAGYDGLLFTPTAEDTPRMIFDGYAAGLPLLGFDISYVRERASQDHATFLLPREQVEESAVLLVELSRNRGRWAELAHLARTAAENHCAESWYRLRAGWTIEAVERHHR
jgi:glycosyltransferase involved in cell wall biosynthesis